LSPPSDARPHARSRTPLAAAQPPAPVKPRRRHVRKWRVAGRAEGGVLVEDSSAGPSVLVWGGAWGLWLWCDGDDASSGHAEPYLLLAPKGVDGG
jgi:hypothetical protein